MTLAPLLFSGCPEPFAPGGHGHETLVSDAFFSFRIGSTYKYMGDWNGGEAMPNSDRGWYRHADSSFYFSGRNDTDTYIQFSLRSNFDTSIHLLNLASSVDKYGSILLDLDKTALIGNATLTLPGGIYSTDSLHTGSIKISSIDSSRYDDQTSFVSGTFNFSAVKISGNPSSTDVIQVDSGVISRLRIFTSK